VVPPIAGADLPGVHTFRTLDDTRAILEQASSSRRAVVIGGGLLGLEAARALRQRGLQVTVVHLADRLMEQQLDYQAAQMLARAMANLGVEIRLSATTEEILGGADGLEAVALADGVELPTDMVVLATGVRPDVELARSAGLDVARAIVVDDQLRTSVPGVYAVGECAEHRGSVYGLWAPLLEMAKVAGASLAGVPAAFRGTIPATTLKVAGVELFCCGRTSATAADDEILSMHSRSGRYRKLVVRDNRLAGAILLGNLGEARSLRALLATGERLPEELLEGTVDTAVAAGPPQDPQATACSCMDVSVGKIAAAIKAGDLRTVADVARQTRATTGCGGCRPEVAELLERHISSTAEALPTRS
jgi:ferredoxin-nitrate reductase